jgi:cell division protein FtsQ
MNLRRTPKPKKPARRLGWRRLLSWHPSRRALKATAVLLVAGALGGGYSWAWQRGLPQAAGDLQDEIAERTLAATARAGLAVRDVLVEGRVQTDPRDLRAVLDARRGAPILAFDAYAAKAELERLPWMRRVAVERRLPDTIFVRIEERVPLALWQRQGRFVVIDAEGTEIAGTDPARFSDRLVVVGDDAPAHASALIALLETEPQLLQRVSAAVRVGGRRWNLHLDNGIDVNLPEANAGGAYERLARLVRENGLIDRNLVAVDLRLPDRLILRVAKDATLPAQTQPAQTQPAQALRRPNRPT